MTTVLEVDIAEPRILRDRLVVSADGTSWDKRVSSDVWVEPLLSTLMLRPLCTTTEWRTTFTGDYVRLAKADYTLITPAKWVENHRGLTGNIYLESLGVNERVTTAATWPINRAFFLSLYTHGAQSLSRGIAIECGWGTPGAAGTVSLRVLVNGDFEIYKGTSSTPLTIIEPSGSPEAFGRQGKGSVVEKTYDILIIPCRRRDLLVVCNDGAGFCYTFQDLDPNASVNTITPSAPFWWYVPEGKASVQCVPIKFKTSGNAYGQITRMRYPPATGQTFTSLSASDATGFGTQAVAYSLVDPATLLPFTPNGVLNSVRIRANLTGDGNSTMFVYAVDFKSPRTTTTTYSAPFNIMPWIMEMELNVPEIGPATLDFVTKAPQAMQDAGLPQVLDIGDRPARLVIDGVDIWRGTLAKPQPEIGRNDALTRAAWKGLDRWLQFLLYTFADTFPYDGIAFSDTILDLATTPGFASSDCDITADTFKLPFSTGVSAGEWQLLPQRDDSVDKWLRQLLTDYAATWITGWAPTASGYVFRFRSPESFSSSPVVSLYRSTLDAIAAGVASDMRARRTVRALRQLPEPAEANQTLVVGYDPRLKQLVQSQYDDTASQNPATTPALRPKNWRGQLVRYQLIDPAIATQAASDRARDIVTSRYTLGRDNIEWESDFLILGSGVPVWKGDRARIYKGGSTTDVFGEYRVLSLNCKFIKEKKASGQFAIVRQATYRGLKVA